MKKAEEKHGKGHFSIHCNKPISIATPGEEMLTGALFGAL